MLRRKHERVDCNCHFRQPIALFNFVHVCWLTLLLTDNITCIRISKKIQNVLKSKKKDKWKYPDESKIQ